MMFFFLSRCFLGLSNNKACVIPYTRDLIELAGLAESKAIAGFECLVLLNFVVGNKQ